MEGKTIKQLLIDVEKNFKLILDIEANLHADILEGLDKVYAKKRLAQLERKHEYLKGKVSEWGTGKAVLITYDEWKADIPAGHQVRQKKHMQLLLINTDLESSRVYFDFFIDKNKDLIIFESLEFKEILAGTSYETSYN